MRKIFRQTHFQVECRVLIILAVLAASGFFSFPALGQTSSQRLFGRMQARFVAEDSLRRATSFSYDLNLTSTLYLKNDSAQVFEEWRLTQNPDSIRARRLSRRTNGKAELIKKYEAPIKIQSVKRDPRQQIDGPLTAAIWDLLDRIKKDSRSHVMIDGETTGRDGAKNYVIKFLANDRAGSFWVNAQTAGLERVEWAYGKSIGLSSSGEKSTIELAPVFSAVSFPVKLVFNERSRTLLRRTGAYTEIATRNFQREDTP